MSKRIITTHSFDVAVATILTVPKAILLKDYATRGEFNQANGRHLYAGLAWMYDTAKAITQTMPYLNPKSVSRWNKEMHQAGLLFQTDAWNKRRNDRTLWYTVNVDAYNQMAAGIHPAPEDCENWRKQVAKTIGLTISQNEKSFSQNEKSFSQNEATSSQNEATLPSLTYSKPTLTDGAPIFKVNDELTPDQMAEAIKHFIIADGDGYFGSQVATLRSEFKTDVFPIIKDVLNSYAETDQWANLMVPTPGQNTTRYINKVLARAKTFLKHRAKDASRDRGGEAAPATYDRQLA